MSDQTAPPDPTPRYRVVAGGVPSSDELAAVVVALTPVVVEPAAEPDDLPAWLKASLHEAVSGVPVTSARHAADLR